MAEQPVTNSSSAGAFEEIETTGNLETATIGEQSGLALGQATPEPLVVNRPAPGITQQITLEPGQPVLLNVPAEQALITIDGANFVLGFDDDGNGTMDSRVVFLNLVDQAASESPPQFVVGGQVIDSGLLISQTIALGGGNGEPIAFDTAASPEPATGSGANVYNDDLGNTIDLLLAQGVIDPTSLVFTLPDPEPGLAQDEPEGAIPGVGNQLFAPVDFNVSVTAQAIQAAVPTIAPAFGASLVNLQDIPEEGFFYEFQVGFGETPDDNIRGTDEEDGTTESFTITSLPEDGYLAIDLNSDGSIDLILDSSHLGTPDALVSPADTVFYYLPFSDGPLDGPAESGGKEGFVLPENVSFNYFTTDSDGLNSDGAVVTIDFPAPPETLEANPDSENVRPNRVDDANAPATFVTIDVLANDSDSAGDPLTLLTVTLDNPAQGSAEVVDNQVVFTPAPGITETTVSMAYTMRDPDGNTESSTVQVTIGQDVSVQRIVSVPDSDAARTELLSTIDTDTVDVDGANGSSTDPTGVNVELYPNSDVTFTVTADPEAPAVLDLYILQDLTGSFRDDLVIVRGEQSDSNDAADLGLLDDLVNGVEAIASDVQFGLGSFRDTGASGGDAPNSQYNFAHHLDLAPGEGGARLDGDPANPAPANLNLPAGEGAAYDEFFAGDPNSSEATGLGGDFPERQLFSLNEVAKDAIQAEDGDDGTTSDFGFRSGSSKVVVIITDATSKDWDNPGFIAELKANLAASGIIPIFLVANGDEVNESGPDFINDFYDAVIETLGVGARVSLDDDSSNLVEAIQQGLGEITQNLTLNIEGDENGYVTVGDPVVDPDTGEHTWDVTLSAPLNKGHNNDPDITLTVTNSSTNEQVGGDINVNVTTDAAASGGDDYDIVEGHNGQNLLHGGAGNDLIIGLGGDDILFGDAGDDVFSFGARDNGVVLDFDGNDIIQDFVKGEDQVNLEALLDALGAGAADVSVTVNGGNTEITVAGATDFMVTLTGITDTLTVGSDPESDIVI
jgi:hypothetical protein